MTEDTVVLKQDTEGEMLAYIDGALFAMRE
jgi:hypothetical protein